MQIGNKDEKILSLIKSFVKFFLSIDLFQKFISGVSCLNFAFQIVCDIIAHYSERLVASTKNKYRSTSASKPLSIDIA